MAAAIARYHTPAMLDLARQYGFTENFVGQYHEHDHQLVYAQDNIPVPDKLVPESNNVQYMIFEFNFKTF